MAYIMWWNRVITIIKLPYNSWHEYQRTVSPTPHQVPPQSSSIVSSPPSLDWARSRRLQWTLRGSFTWWWNIMWLLVFTLDANALYPPFRSHSYSTITSCESWLQVWEKVWTSSMWNVHFSSAHFHNNQNIRNVTIMGLCKLHLWMHTFNQGPSWPRSY